MPKEKQNNISAKRLHQPAATISVARYCGPFFPPFVASVPHQVFRGFFSFFFLTATGTWVLTSCRVSKTRTENLGRKIPCDFPAHLLLQSAQGADGEGRRGRSYLAHDSRLKIQRYRNVQHYANVLKPERKYYVLPTAR